MGKCFYSIDLDCSKSFKTLCDLICCSCENNIHWYQEIGFNHFIKSNTLIYSCNEGDTVEFEKMLNKYGVLFCRKDELKEKYQIYLSTFPSNSQCGEKIPDDNQKTVFEEEIPQIIEGSNGCQCFTEETITNKDKIKVYIESNEMCNHHIPHAHVDYNHDFNVFSISLVDFSILAGDGRGPKAKKASQLLKDNIEEAKRIWNSCQNHSKFDIDETGKILDTYKFV